MRNKAETIARLIAMANSQANKHEAAVAESMLKKFGYVRKARSKTAPPPKPPAPDSLESVFGRRYPTYKSRDW